MIQTSDTWVVRSIARGAMPASRIGSEWRYWKPLVLARILHAPQDITPGPPEPDVVTATELAALLRMAPHTISDRIADGSIPAFKVGKGWRIHWPTVRGRLERGEPFYPGDFPTGRPQ